MRGNLFLTSFRTHHTGKSAFARPESESDTVIVETLHQLFRGDLHRQIAFHLFVKLFEIDRLVGENARVERRIRFDVGAKDLFQRHRRRLEFRSFRFRLRFLRRVVARHRRGQFVNGQFEETTFVFAITVV